jgi:hypothetical protein
MGDINKESCPCGWKRPRGRPTHDEAQKAAKTAEARRHGYVWPRPVPQEKLQQRELAKVVTKEKREKRKREKEEGMAAGKRQRQVEDQPPLSFQAALASEPQQFQQPGETGQVPAWLSIEEKVRQELTAFLAWSPVEEDNAEQLQRSEEDEQIRSQDDEEQFRWPEESEVDEIPASEAATPYQAQEPGEVQSVPELDNIWFGLNYLDALKHHHSRESNPLLDPDIALFYKTYEEGMSGMVEYLNEQDPEPAPEAVSDAESFMGHPSLFGDLDGLEL